MRFARPLMLNIGSLTLLVIAIALVAVIVIAALARRIRLPLLTSVLMLAGLLSLALAIARTSLDLPHRQWVAVMLDASPSTRSAALRDNRALAKRVRELLPDGVPHRVFHFAQERVPATLDSTVVERPVDRTRYDPPTDAAAVLLFSDGRFESSEIVPPTYAVIDATLDEAPDARVSELEIREGTVAATVRAPPSDSRELNIGGSIEHVGGPRTVMREFRDADQSITAQLGPPDLWPENDSLTIRAPPPVQLARWWVGGSPPDESWTSVAPQSLPADAAAYLDASIIVLDNVPADAIAPEQQQRLMQYVRDLGGGLVILGGDRAFAAGGYAGSTLETLSPLASTPPAPTTHWVLLADSSGSMAAVVGQQTRWDLAAGALAQVLPSLPPNDPVSIGHFARDVHFWSQGKPARAIASTALPPAGIAPHGPTNLQQAIESVIGSSDGSMPVELLVLSDADAKVDVPALAGPMRSKRIRLHLLATADIGADNPLRRLVEASGGSIDARADPRQWASGVRELLRAASPRLVSNDPIDVRFVGPLSSLGKSTMRTWNQVWAKEDVTPLATAEGAGQQLLAAQWNVGAGRVLAAAFQPDRSSVDAMARLVEAAPRDPRLRVTWQTGAKLRISIDAVEGNTYLNDLRLSLDLHDASANARAQAPPDRHAIPQVAPGRYEIALDAPRAPVIAIARHDDRVIERRALAGRYAPEFDTIGNDRPALRALAERSGGRVIEPGEAGPIHLEWPARRFDLTAILSVAAALLIALGLIWWKLR